MGHSGHLVLFGLMDKKPSNIANFDLFKGHLKVEAFQAYDDWYDHK